MAVLVACSAFFSGSEAALFYLRPQDRRALATGGRAQRLANQILGDPDRLLSAVLLWNLATNMTYFGIVSIVGLRLERELGATPAILFSVGSVLIIIFFSELLPKSLAVLRPSWTASLVAFPLTAAVRFVDPLMPTLQVISLLSRRLFLPRFKDEPYLQTSDLERAIERSDADSKLLKHERATLRNIVGLSDIRADEWMRPRTQFALFRPPISLDDLAGEMTPSGYLLIAAGDGDDIVGAVNLARQIDLSYNNLEQNAETVIYMPWCATVADVLQQMQQEHREVVAVVNEFGETIGVLTVADILDTIFHTDPSRSERLLDREPIRRVKNGVWHVNEMTNLSRLERHFGVALPHSKSVTVAGMIQERLQRMPHTNDQVSWGPFLFRILELPLRGPLRIELTRRTMEDESQ